MLYSVEDRWHVHSVHLSRTKAMEELGKVRETDKSSVYYIESYSSKTLLPAVAAILIFVLIGVMLAWRG